MLKIRDVAMTLGTGSTFVEQLIETGQLAAHRLNAGTGSRMTIRIPREQVIRYLLETRSVEPALHLAGVLNLLQAMSAPELAIIQDKMPRLAEAARQREALPAMLGCARNQRRKVKCRGAE